MKMCRPSIMLVKDKCLRSTCVTTIQRKLFGHIHISTAYYFHYRKFSMSENMKNYSIYGMYCGYDKKERLNMPNSNIGLSLRSSFLHKTLLYAGNGSSYITNILRTYSSKTIKSNIFTGNHISSLKTKKRIQRKKIQVDEQSEKEFQVVAQATADEYDLERLSKAFNFQGLYVETPIIQTSPKEDIESVKTSNLSDPENVVYLCAAYHVTQEPRTMYIFREGVIVFWNIPSLERQNILKFIEEFQSGKYADDIVHEETETLIYMNADSPTRLKPKQNVIIFSERGDTELEKFTFSNALAMSVKLGIWESSLDSYIESIEHVTEKLRESGIVVLRQREVLRKMGQLFALRHLINLSSDLLDTPDFYWEHESLGILYNKMANHLSIHKRTSVMNTKLSHCLELMELLKSDLNERHSSRLEWIIIILIMVEVFFEVLHYV